MGIFSKTIGYFKEHLGKTRDKISSSLSSVLSIGRNIDDELLDQLEETLIKDDIGGFVGHSESHPDICHA